MIFEAILVVSLTVIASVLYGIVGSIASYGVLERYLEPGTASGLAATIGASATVATALVLLDAAGIEGALVEYAAMVCSTVLYAVWWLHTYGGG